jgi:hypothetical protein
MMTITCVRVCVDDDYVIIRLCAMRESRLLVWDT